MLHNLLRVLGISSTLDAKEIADPANGRADRLRQRAHRLLVGATSTCPALSIHDYGSRESVVNLARQSKGTVKSSTRRRSTC